MAAPRKLTIKLRPVGAKPAAPAAAAPAAPTPAPAPAPVPPPAPETPVVEEMTPIVEPPATPAPEVKVEVPEVKVEAPEVKVEAPEVKVEAPEVKVEAPEVKVEAPVSEVKVEVPATDEMTPVVETTAPTTEAPAPTTEAPKVVTVPKIKLKTPSAPAPTVEVTTESAQQAKRQTSRIELPPEITAAPMNAKEDATTIRLKPISQTATPAKDDTQASKSKTARIALDSVLGGIQANTPLANTTQKTIKLKRAVAPAGASKSTPSTPMATSATTGDEDKTIKINKRPAGISIKKPTLGLKKPSAPTPATENLETLEELETLDDTSMPMIMPVESVATESGVSKAFTAIGAVAALGAIIVGVMVWLVFQNQASSPDGSEPNGNTLHSFAMERF